MEKSIESQIAETEQKFEELRRQKWDEVFEELMRVKEEWRDVQYSTPYGSGYTNLRVLIDVVRRMLYLMEQGWKFVAPDSVKGENENVETQH